MRAANALTISLVAAHNSVLAGQVAFSPVTVASNPARRRVLGLAPIAVTPDRQRQGIGRALIRAGLDAAREASAGAVVLLGSVDYYSRSGFEPAAPRGLTWGDGSHDIYLQVIGLVPGALDTLSGTIRYHAAFDSL